MCLILLLTNSAVCRAYSKGFLTKTAVETPKANTKILVNDHVTHTTLFKKKKETDNRCRSST